ncbi:putative redox protein, regulator of disulfide bond formation [Metallosphaera yellowstonensis MK1]|uniref:Putative redox protein, regulator of disulfide bond formation n=2 Tax=Metallosphaera TaxID=41980 RepID=H2C4X6_9CREN|nr:putative redox protein, regulator of disulfide bond formation [Metallosphaera yellowstonensis MK1]
MFIMIKMSLKIYKKLDLTGQSCAGPLGELSGVLEEISPGEAVEAVLGDEATKKDVVAWATKKGYKIVQERRDGNNYVVVLTK